MKIKATDPDIFSICTRIERGIINLKPEFQRGYVWNSTKKRLLIDSILRDWQVPPIHVIRASDVQEVLDGQQRLRAIYGFYNGDFTVNGKIEPYLEDIALLDGKRYDDLPSDMKRQFDHYSIRIFEITEYSSGESGELFNRLNNALNLTAAEKRNAHVGHVTNQAKELVRVLDDRGLDKGFLGFSNNRMAYDDLLIKICYMLEQDGLATKITDKLLSSRYKSDEAFEGNIILAVESSINLLGVIKNHCDSSEVDAHVTKATAFSWLYFIAKLYLKHGSETDENRIINAFILFEGQRFLYRNHLEFEGMSSISFRKEVIEDIFDLYNERASSKVMTLQSMLIREILIAIFYYQIPGNKTHQLDTESAKIVEKLTDSLQVEHQDTKLLIAELIATDLEGGVSL